MSVLPREPVVTFTPEDVFELWPRFLPPTIDGIDFNRFKDNRPGTGAYGIVYHGWQVSAARSVAVKVTNGGGIDDDESVMQGPLEHSNIVRLYSAGQLDDGHRYLVLEWMDGGSLEKRRAEWHSLPTSDWIKLFRKLAQALDHIHINSKLHRDIKPDNILLSSDDDKWHQNPKLGDFGIAVNGTTSSGYRGPKLYRAPEVNDRNGQTKESDVYALGVTMYECLTGKFPPTLLPNSNSEKKMPPRLWRVIRTCLAAEPEERGFGNKERPAQGLDDALAEMEKKRQPLLAWFAATGLLVALVCVGWVLWYVIARHRQDNVRRVKSAAAVKRAENYRDQIKGVQACLDAGDSPNAIVALNATDTDMRGWEWVHLRAQCYGSLASDNFGGAVEALAVGPDGQVVVATTGGRVRVVKWGDKGSSVEVIGKFEGREALGLYLTPGNRVAAFVGRMPGTRLVANVIVNRSLTGGPGREANRHLIEPHEMHRDLPAPPALSPDGRNLAFPGANAKILSLELATDKLETVAEDVPRVTALAFSRDGKALAACTPTQLRIWEWPAMKERAGSPLAISAAYLAMAFVEKDALVAVDDKGKLIAWRVSRSGWVSEQERLDGLPAIRVGIAPSGKAVAVSGNGVAVWSPEEKGNWKPRRLLGAQPRVSALAFSPDSKRVFTGDDAGIVQEWNVWPGMGLHFAVPEGGSLNGIDARIVDGRVFVDGKEVVLAVKAERLVAHRAENGGATRLLVVTGERVAVAVDTQTGEPIYWQRSEQPSKAE